MQLDGAESVDTAPAAPMSAKQRKAALTRYRNQLSPVLDAMDTTTRTIAAPLILDCARLRVMMDDCWATYLSEGAVAEYQNGGGQGGLREHPCLGSYIKCQRSLAANVAKLTGLVGRDASAGDALAEFLAAARS